MSRKDYAAIAGALRTELELEGRSNHALEVVRGIALRLADGFGAENAAFDRARFLASVLG